MRGVDLELHSSALPLSVYFLFHQNVKSPTSMFLSLWSHLLPRCLQNGLSLGTVNQNQPLLSVSCFLLGIWSQ